MRRGCPGSSTTRSPAALTCRTSRSSRRSSLRRSPAGPSPTPTLLGFAASRAHHADVGGESPGRCRRTAARLEEEGVVISPRPLDEAALEELVARMRQPDERRADLRAQLAANRAGAMRLVELRGARSARARLREATDAVLDYSERRTRACMAALPDGVHGPRRARGARGRPGAAPARRVSTASGCCWTSRAAHPTARGQPQLPAGGHALGLPVRGAGTDRPGHPAVAGAYRPIEVRAPRGHAAERPAGRRGGGGQRRDVLARGGPRAGARSAARRVRAR